MSRFRKAKRTGLSVHALRQTPVLEHLPKRGIWLIWLAYDHRYHAGTYLELRPDGTIWRMTEDTDGSIVRVARIS